MTEGAQISDAKTRPSDVPNSDHFTPYDLFVAVAALMSLMVLGYREFVPNDTELAVLLDIFDTGFCLIFFLDYIRNIVRAPDRGRYLRTWGIFDLASSIPVIGVFRVFRIVRLVRVLRALRSIRILFLVARKDKPAAIFVVVMTLTMSLFIGICIAVLQFEADAPGANIKDAHDVIWWAVVTSSTVGYGNEYPVTAVGRFLAGILMFVGIGLFATASGSIAGLAIRSLQRESEEPQMHLEIAALRAAVSRIESTLNAERNHPQRGPGESERP
ncbi:MAG: ion transporter [Myxococcota bacterium]